MKVSAALIFRDKTDKLGRVKISIFQTINKRKDRKYISTPYKLPVSYWNSSTSRAWKTPKSEEINNYLDTEIAKIQKRYSNNVSNTGGEKISSFHLTFIQFLDGHIKYLLSKEKIGEYERYKAFKTKMEGFLRTKNIADFEFDDINLQFLKDFDEFVRGTGLKQSTVHGYVKKLGTLYRKAVKSGYNPKFNPFGFFENPECKTKKHALSVDQVNILEKNAYLPPENLTLPTFHALNIFLFQVYATGLRVGDALLLKWSNLSGLDIIANVRKSSKTSTIPLRGNLKVINILRYYMPSHYKIAYLKLYSDTVMENTLEPYEKDQLFKEIQLNYEVTSDGDYIEHPRKEFIFDDTYRLEILLALYSEISLSDHKIYHIFPFIKADTSKMSALKLYDEVGNATTKVNLQLKNLMPLIRTNLSLSSHISRHTFTRIARPTEDIATISQMLVHASVAETDTYINEIEDPALSAAKVRIANSF